MANRAGQYIWKSVYQENGAHDSLMTIWIRLMVSIEYLLSLPRSLSSEEISNEMNTGKRFDIKLL